MKQLVCFCFIFILAGAATPAPAGTKEEIQRLSSDVLALQNHVRVLAKHFAHHMQSMQSLVGQLNDQVGKSNTIL